jgi:hypothetical protein
MRRAPTARAVNAFLSPEKRFRGYLGAGGVLVLSGAVSGLTGVTETRGEVRSSPFISLMMINPFVDVVWIMIACLSMRI